MVATNPDNPDWPDVVELRLEMPTALELDYGTALAQQRIAERVRQREQRAWEESKRTGIAFVGARRVLRQAPTKRLEASIRSFPRPGIEGLPQRPCDGSVRSMRSTTRPWRRGPRASAPCAFLMALGGCGCVMELGADRHHSFE